MRQSVDESFINQYKKDIDFLVEEQKIAILEEVIALMKEKGISRAELARRLGTSRAYITRMFRLKSNFTLKTLVQLAHALGTKISIHLCEPEVQTVWIDKNYYPKKRISDKLAISAREYKDVKYVKSVGVTDEYRTDAA